MPYDLILGPAEYRTDIATERMFGGNVVFTRDFVDVGGPFEWVVDTLGLQSLRYPGGTVTETLFSPGTNFVELIFDNNNPDGIPPDGIGRILTAPALYQFAASRDLPVQYVIPSDNYMGDAVDADGNRFPSAFGLYRILSRVDLSLRGGFGEQQVDTYLIGNEFWYDDDRLTPTEYGRFANELVKGLQFTFDRYRDEQPDPDAWVEPKIAVQAGRGWIPAENAAVLAQLDMEARGAVDTVLQHFYPRFYQHVANSRGAFDRMDEFQNAEGFGDLTYYISEWNTFLSQDADKGLMQASTLLETMRTFMDRGVDEATIWGIQYEQLNGRLATKIVNPDGSWTSTLTAGGEVFRMMNPGLVGMRVLDIDTPAALRSHLFELPADRPAGSRDQAVMHAWGSDERTIIFLSSRTDTEMEFTLDVQGLIPDDWHHAWQLQMGVLDNPATARNEGDPIVNWARPHLTTQSGDLFITDSVFEVTLGPWEVARLEFLHGDQGARMWSQEFLVDPAVDHSETMVGSRNADTIMGGLGNDRLYGRAGDDILFSGPGDNRLFGENGADLVIGWDGNNQLSGGPGTDHFAVSVRGQNVIRDFDPDRGETLSFMGHYDSPDQVLARTSLTAWAGTGPAQDLLITHDAGGSTVLLGGAAYADRLGDSLSDFDPLSEAVQTLQQMGLYEIPLERPDIPPPPVENTALLNEITRLAINDTPEEFAAALDRFTPEELAAFAQNVNPTILSLYTEQPFGVLLNRLDDASLEDFLSRAWSGTFDQRLSTNLAKGLTPVVQNPVALRGILERHSAEFGVELTSNPASNYQQHLSNIFRFMEASGVLPSDLEMFDDVDVRQDSEGRYFVANEAGGVSPDPPAPVPPTDDDDDDGDPPPLSVAGPGCFVATAVYRDGEHPDVAALRSFRYSVLARTRAGRLLCEVYYHHAGPWMARRLDRAPRLRRVIRAALTRIARHIRHRHGATVWPGRGH